MFSFIPQKNQSGVYFLEHPIKKGPPKRKISQTCVGVLNVKVSPTVDAASAKFLWLSKTWTARKFEGLRKRLVLSVTGVSVEPSLRCTFPRPVRVTATNYVKCRPNH